MDIFSWDTHFIGCSSSVWFWPWNFPHLLKVDFFKSLLNRRATRTFLVPVNLQDLRAWGDSSSDTTSSCQTDETQSWLMIWLVPRLWGLLPTRWHAQSSAQMPTACLVCCVRICRRFHVCVLVVNPPVRFCTVCSRGQSKECRRVGQSGHQRANQSVMDFPVTDTQLGSPSSRCRSQLEVFLGLSVSKVVGALCAMTLKLQDCQKHDKVIILKPWLCFSSLLRLLTFLPVATKNTFPEKTPGTLGCLAEKIKNKTQPKTLDCSSQIWEAELEKSQEELIKC